MAESGDRPAQVKARKDAFLAAFALTGNVSEAARRAGVTRTTPYGWAADEPDFKAAWDIAEQQAIDALELEARRRAELGVEDYVVSQGKLVYITDEETGETKPLVKRVYSDTLMVLLLKAHRPERYSDKLRAEVTQAEPLKITLDFGSRDQT